MDVVLWLLPTLVGICFGAILCNVRHKSLSQRVMIWAMFVAAFYFTCDVMACAPFTPPNLVVWGYLLASFFVPQTPLFLVFFLWTLHTASQRYNKRILLWYLSPFVMCMAILLVYRLIGFDAAAEYYEYGGMLPPGLSNADMFLYDIFELVAVHIYQWVCALSALACIIYVVYLMWRTDLTPRVIYAFFRERGPLRPLHVILVLLFLMLFLSATRTFASRPFFVEHTRLFASIFALQGLILAAIGLVALRCKQPCIYWHRRHRKPFFEDMPTEIRVVYDKRRLLTEQEDIESDSYRTLNLRDEFKEVMREHEFYRMPGMNRYVVASMLEVNPSAIDRLVRLLYHITYEEYVMAQRVEYYYRYRKLYSNEPPTTIAMECGFPNVDVMNRQLKECQAFFIHTATHIGKDQG